jgi:hypothetical protein
MTTTRLCPDTVQLQRFVARDLSENAYTLVEEHIRQCGNCEEAITALSQTGYSLIACNDEAPQTRMPQRPDAPSWCGAEPGLLILQRGFGVS